MTTIRFWICTAETLFPKENSREAALKRERLFLIAQLLRDRIFLGYLKIETHSEPARTFPNGATAIWSAPFNCRKSLKKEARQLDEPQKTKVWPAGSEQTTNSCEILCF